MLFKSLFVLGSVNALACRTLEDCPIGTYGEGSCCLQEEDRWGEDGYTSSILCRTADQISLHTNQPTYSYF